MEDRCVCCGEIVPEGGQICSGCFKKSQECLNIFDSIIHDEWKKQNEVEEKLYDALRKHYIPVWEVELQKKGLLTEDDTNQQAKADSGKPILSLVPKEIIYEIEKVRSFGSKKYQDANSWKKVELERYHQALLRHTLAVWNEIDARDEESGLLHLSHIATNIAFILEMLKDKE